MWRKTAEKQQDRLKEKAKKLLAELNAAYGTAFLRTGTDERTPSSICQGYRFVHGTERRKPRLQRDAEAVAGILEKQEQYRAQLHTMDKRNSYSKAGHDAAFMRMKEAHMGSGQRKPAYNVQLAVESEYIVSVDISSGRDDMLRLKPLLTRMEQNLGRRHKRVVADAGYESEKTTPIWKRRRNSGLLSPKATGNPRNERTGTIPAEVKTCLTSH